MNNNGSPQIVPFGKYKGQPLEVLVNDANYVEWLNGQGWVKDKYPQFYTVIINNFQEPSDTPEHNALQAMFLDDELCMRFLNLMGGDFDKEFLLRGIEAKRFEVDGIDVLIHFCQWELDNRDSWCITHAKCIIEIKPSIGDDFPSVLRQVCHIKGFDVYRCVVFRDFVATSVTLEQVRAMFKHSGVLLFSLEEIQAFPIRIYPNKKSLDD